MKKNAMIIIVALIICFIIVIFMIKNQKIPTETPITPTPGQTEVPQTNDFDFDIIKEAAKKNKGNYLISPLSIAWALKMADEGALGNTKLQIDNVLGNYKLNKDMNVKDKIGIANLIFIKDIYKNDVKYAYIQTLQNHYGSDVLYDEFITPKAANDWISKKTYNMIDNAINDISKDFILGLANAIAIDVEWKNQFDCYNTHEAIFTKENNSKLNVAMMHSSNDVAYIKNNNAEGIIKDYAIYDKNTGKIVFEENENTVALEYIAILPNSNVDDYIKTFNRNELNSLLSSKKYSSNKLDINLSLPKYTYDFDFSDFKESLINLGMTDAFTASANFKGITDIEMHISQAIHKTHIELSESGTKAAAVTVLTFDKNAMVLDKKEVINIEFNRPFIYIIKEKNTNNIWFFGTVHDPLKYEDNKSECK